ncbi:MAG TPA: PEP-CTERM sorting domain-containing protein, partial [Casimicrobiaceae bacterium]
PTYDLGSGAFSASGGTGSVALAQTFLNHLGDAGNQPSKYVVTLLHSESEQDFVTATPIPTGRCTDCAPDKIPEPATLPLLGAGVAALLFATRRRLIKQL